MLAYTYIEKGKFALVEKPKPVLIEPTKWWVWLKKPALKSLM